MFEDENRKSWERYEQAFHLYRTKPVVYYWKTAWVILNGILLCLTEAIIIGLCAYLVYNKPISRLSFAIMVNVVISIWFYIVMIRNMKVDGILLKKKEFPELYREINYIARDMKAGAISRIYLTNDVNAGVTTLFPLIPFMKRNVLTIGYPFLCGISAKALMGCLAHEFGHLIGNHPIKMRLLGYLEIFLNAFQFGVITLILAPWKHWIIRRMNQLLLPLLRQNEKDADEYILKVLGSGYAAETLLQMVVRDDLLEESFYTDLMERPDFKQLDLAVVLRDRMQLPISREEARMKIAKAMRSGQPVFEVHPPYSERLDVCRIKDDPVEYALRSPDALERLFGKHPTFLQTVNEELHKVLDPIYDECQSHDDFMRSKVKDLDPARDYTRDEYSDHLWNLYHQSSHREMFHAMLNAALSRFPETPDFLALQLKDQLSNEEDAFRRKQIVVRMESLIRQYPVHMGKLLDDLFSYYLERGDNEKIKQLFDFRDSAITKIESMVNASLAPTDHLVLLEAPPTMVERIVEFSRKNSVIKRIYLVRRLYETGVETSYLVCDCHCGSFSLDNRTDVQSELETEFSDDFKVELMDKKFCDSVLEKIPGACVYRRDSGKKVRSEEAKSV